MIYNSGEKMCAMIQDGKASTKLLLLVCVEIIYKGTNQN